MRRLGPYALEDELGSGGMGKVFRARHVELGTQHAIKLLRLEFTQDIELARRFQREMQGLAAFSHPHVVPIHSAGQEQGRLYFVMDLLPGPSLDELLSRHELPTPQEAAGHARGVASALSALHAQGAVHRDVKPANVLLDERGQARLTDFGLMRLVCDEASRLTRTGQLLGTPAFMAPEQARGGTVGPPCDVWALGMLLYTLLRGHPAWSGGEAEVMAQVRTGKAEPLPATVPSELRRICASALEPEPDQRPGAAEVEIALQRYLSIADEGPRWAPWLLLGVTLALACLVAMWCALYWPAGPGPGLSPGEAPQTPSPAASLDHIPSGSRRQVSRGSLRRGSLIMIETGDQADAPEAQLAWIVSSSQEDRPEVQLLLGGNLQRGPSKSPLEGYRRDAFGVGANCLVLSSGSKHPCAIVRRVGPVALVRFEDLSSKWISVSELTLIGEGADPGPDAKAAVGLASWRGVHYPAVVVARASQADPMLRVAFLLDGGSWVSQSRLYDLPAKGDRIHFTDEKDRVLSATVLGYPGPWVVEIQLANDLGRRVLVELGRIKVTKADRRVQ